MKPLLLLLQSSIGKKFIMGVTGAALVLFVIGHLVGNLQVFLPKEAINAYAHLLHSNAGLLWGVRLGLLAVVGLHVWAAVTLTAENKAARPHPYVDARTPFGASWASRYMFQTGLVVAAFVIYHLLHYTAQVPAVNLLAGTDPAKDFNQLLVASGPQTGFRDVHAMLVAGFKQPLVTLFYLVAIGLLCLHLSHGMAAMFQSLGIQEGLWRKRLEVAARALAVALFAGYASIPIAVYLRIVQ